MSASDAFTPYEPALAATPVTDPWRHASGQPPNYAPDYMLLEQLLGLSVSAGHLSESGRFAKAIDAWLARELRRAGFGFDEVWPRETRPRVLPRDIAVLLNKLPRQLAADLQRRIAKMPAVGPSDARVLGRAYDKQIDVCLARWDRGPELLVSTKAQVSSFAKNLPNRFEEAYGDAGNLGRRYPMAATGFFFVQRSTILDLEPDAFERTVDMMRKLRSTADTDGYTATGLAVVGWSDLPAAPAAVRIRPDVVPDDVAAPQFITALVEKVLATTPVSHHVGVRERIERRHIPVAEDDTMAETSDGEG